MWRIRPSGLERLMRGCGQRGNHEDGGGKGGSDSHWVLLFLVLRGGGVVCVSSRQVAHPCGWAAPQAGWFGSYVARRRLQPG